MAAQETYINIDKIAELKGLKSNRSLRVEINKENSKYKARKIKTQGGYTYEILFSTLESEIQDKLIDEEIKSHSLIPVNNKSEFRTQKLKTEALAKVDLITSLKNFRTHFRTQKEADLTFLELYNSDTHLKDVYKILGKVAARSSLLRWIKTYEDNNENWESLVPHYKCSKVDEYNTELRPEEISQFEKFLFHPNKFKISKAIALSKFCLKKKGVENLHSDSSYRRYAQHIRKTRYDKWVLFREGEKAFNDKVEPYIERDLSKIEFGDILVADGHVLNFQVLNPFTGSAVRATLVGFFEWKSGTLAGYEIMMSENTQCIASALRNSILNLGKIPKIVYWLKYHNSKPCPHVENMTIQECLNTIQKEDINKSILNDLMMKSEIKTVHRNGVRFLGQNYYNEALFGFREKVYVRYSLFDLSKVYVYSLKGEFICSAKQVQKVHPMANHLGTVKDMEDFKQIIQRNQRIKKKAVKEFKKYFDIETTGILELPEIEKPVEIEPAKPKKEKKLTVREQQMNRPYFASDVI